MVITKLVLKHVLNLKLYWTILRHPSDLLWSFLFCDNFWNPRLLTRNTTWYLKSVLNSALSPIQKKKRQIQEMKKNLLINTKSHWRKWLRLQFPMRPRSLKNRLFTNIYITVESTKTIYETPFKKWGWDHAKIWRPSWNYFFF